jgi:glycosyltransferase involved in cell wall biosynthesis
MQRNRGAYAARNHGLDMSTGEFITLHDADDWSHPQKIETQVKYMLSVDSCVACTSEMFRSEESLRVGVLRGDCSLISSNTSSLMFRKQPIVEKIGYWDNVRFGADGQMMRRIRMAFGKDSLHHINTGPLSFQRYTDKSITADPSFGYAGFKFGARRTYEELSIIHFKDQGLARFNGISPQTIHYTPKPLRTTLAQKRTHYDVVIASDFRFPGGTTSSNAEELKAQKKYGLRTGLLELFSYGLNPERRLNKKIIDLLEPEYAELIVFGEEVSCDILIIRQPMALDPIHRHLPKVNAKNIRVIINQPPRANYQDNGRVLYNLARCHRNVERVFGSGAVWHPIGPVVRSSLVKYHSEDLQSLILSDQDWMNIIDHKAWRRSSNIMLENRPVRICRHSRDSYLKWPDKATTLEKAYPNANDIEVHVLGGAEVPKQILGGRLPNNWHVCPFGTMDPKEFLAQHDFFVYFTHPGWIESFGRVIFEAMAVGLPVLLPKNIGYEDLFDDAALYLSESDVESSIRHMMADSELYNSQIQKGYRIVREKFAHEAHINRIKAIMNGSNDP